MLSYWSLRTPGYENNFVSYIDSDGVYWWNTSDGSKPVKLLRSNFSVEQKKAGIGGFASAVAGGLIGDALGGGESIVRGVAIGAALGGGKIKSESLALSGTHAAVVLSGDQASNPTFRFYFPKTEMDAFKGQADSWYYQWMNSIQSPNEFECVKLKEKKNKRTLPSGMDFSIAGFGSSTEGKKSHGKGARRVILGTLPGSGLHFHHLRWEGPATHVTSGGALERVLPQGCCKIIPKLTVFSSN